MNSREVPISPLEDAIHKFMQKTLFVSKEDEVGVHFLFNSFKEWVEKEGHGTELEGKISMDTFCEEMRKFYKLKNIKRSDGLYWYDIRKTLEKDPFFSATYERAF